MYFELWSVALNSVEKQQQQHRLISYITARFICRSQFSSALLSIYFEVALAYWTQNLDSLMFNHQQILFNFSSHHIITFGSYTTKIFTSMPLWLTFRWKTEFEIVVNLCLTEFKYLAEGICMRTTFLIQFHLKRVRYQY